MEQGNVRVTVRVDKELKEAADNLFNRLGMNMTTALSVFLRKAVDENCIPFAISLKTPAYSDEFAVAEMTGAFRKAVQKAKDEAAQQGCPVACYDAVNKRAYLEYANGEREYVN